MLPDLVGLRRLRAGRALRAAALALALLASACVPMDDAIQAIFKRSMRNAPSFDPYENPLMPPAGATSFSSGNYPAAPGQVNLGQPGGLAQDVPSFTGADMARGGEVLAGLTNPVPANAQSLARGQVMYDRMCTICHGPQGNPQAAPILPKLPPMVAFPLATGGALLRSDSYIFGMITAGRGIMPAYGHQISYYDRWHIVNYVRQLQGQGPAPGAAAPGAGGQ